MGTTRTTTKTWKELKPKGKGPLGLDWSGVYPSPCMVWTDHNCREMDENAFRQLLRELLTNDIASLGVTLSHEGLTLKERLKAVQIGNEEAKGRLPVRAGAMGEWTWEVIEQGKMMLDAGVDILYLHPTPIGDYEDDFLVDHFKRFDKAVRTPFFILCGLPQVSATAFKRIAMECENLIGYKITCNHDFRAMKAIMDGLREAEEKTGRHACPILAGDVALAECLINGAEGTISGGGVWRVKADVEIFKAVRRGDYTTAFKTQQRIAPATAVQRGMIPGSTHANFPYRYKIMAWLTGNIPRPYARPPWQPCSKQEVLLIREALIKSEFKVVRSAEECRQFEACDY